MIDKCIFIREGSNINLRIKLDMLPHLKTEIQFNSVVFSNENVEIVWLTFCVNLLHVDISLSGVFQLTL